MRRPVFEASRLNVLLPMLVGLVACGGSVSSVEGSSSGASGNSSGGTSGGTSGNTSGGTSGNTSGGTSGGSSGSSGTVPQGDVDLCTSSSLGYQRLVGLTPKPGAIAVDYMELRDEYDIDLPPGPGTPHVVAKDGTLCASATNKADCQSKFTSFRSIAGWTVSSYGNDMGPRKRYLLWQGKDTIEANLTVDDVRGFLVPIENPKDAAFLVTATDQYRVACEAGVKHAKKTDAGWEIYVQSGHTCGKGTHLDGHIVSVTTDGATTLKSTWLIKEGDPQCAVGRRPDGLQPRERAECPSAVGRFFADVAHLEAASVFAFDRLAEELTRLGAPEELVSAARTSREDEVRHTKMTTKLAERFGAVCTEPHVEPPTSRTAFEIAIENAVEGCVRETYGALVAHWQASAANDATIEAVMKRIAIDETNHATLAWQVAAWLEPQLTDAQREAIEAARTQAFVDLRRELEREPATDLVIQAGMPSAERATALLDSLTASLAA